MTKEEAIKYLQQLYPYGGHCWLDEQRIEAIGMAVKALQEEPVSVWHDASKLPDNPEDVVIEHSEYGTAIIPACKMSRVKGSKWVRLDDILKL